MAYSVSDTLFPAGRHTSRKISAQQRDLNRQKRGGGAVRAESAFAEPRGAGINQVDGKQPLPDELAEVRERFAQLLDAIRNETTKKSCF